MRSVALCSAYPAYKLKAADLTISRLSELTVYNMRRLFAAQVSTEHFIVILHIVFTILITTINVFITIVHVYSYRI